LFGSVYVYVYLSLGTLIVLISSYYNPYYSHTRYCFLRTHQYTYTVQCHM